MLPPRHLWPNEIECTTATSVQEDVKGAVALQQDQAYAIGAIGYSSDLYTLARRDAQSL